MLYIIGKGKTATEASEIFGHSESTILKHFRNLISLMMEKRELLLQKRDPSSITPELAKHFKFASFFDNCIGALGSHHFPIILPEGMSKVAWKNIWWLHSQFSRGGEFRYDIFIRFARLGGLGFWFLCSSKRTLQPILLPTRQILHHQFRLQIYSFLHDPL